MHMLPISQDAAIVLGLAGTALPFAGSAPEEAERWLRVLRLHGEAGEALQSMGVAEAALGPAALPPRVGRFGQTARGSDTIVELVAEHAEHYALLRDSERVGTIDVLFAVLKVYGRFFEESLARHGGDLDELLECLASYSYSRVPDLAR